MQESAIKRKNTTKIRLKNSRTHTCHSSIVFEETKLNTVYQFVRKDDASGGYFDPDGRLPYDQLMLSTNAGSGFGGRWHPITHMFTGHQGIDMTSPEGFIRAAGRGIVSNIGFQFNAAKGTGYGNFIDIKHFMSDGSLYKTRYAHLKELPNFNKGDILSEGAILGKMGATGGVTGPHLHFEMYKYNFSSKKWNLMDPTLFNVGQFDTIEQMNSFVGPAKRDGTF